MITLLDYITKIILLQAVLFGIYWFMSRKNSNHQFNRFFLLSTLIIPFILPFIEIPINLSTQQVLPAVGGELFMIQEMSSQVLSKQTITADSASSNWWIYALVLVYVSILSAMTFKLISGYRQIRKLSKRSDRVELTSNGYLLHYVPSRILSFSFFKKIFISDRYKIEPMEKNAIISHEEYHIRQLHSLDVLISEVIRMICWFNPVIHLIQSHLKEIHEFQADQHVCKATNPVAYAKFLRSHQWKEINLRLGNSISGSSINNRIKMMKKKNQTPKFIPVISTLVLSAGLCFFIACNDNIEPLQNQVDEGFQYEFSDADLEQEIEETVKLFLRRAPQDLIDLYQVKQRAHPEYLYMPGTGMINNLSKESFIASFRKGRRLGSNLEMEVVYLREYDPIELKKLNTGIFRGNKNLKGKFRITEAFDYIHKVDRYKFKEYKYKMESDDEIHEVVDKVASFKGGSAGLSQYLKENLNYPEIAKNHGIEDNVVLRFVVTKRGGLLYLNIDERPTTNNEEVSIELEKAAFFAINKTRGMWEPAEKDGRYVLSRVTLPIEFKLE